MLHNAKTRLLIAGALFCASFGQYLPARVVHDYDIFRKWLRVQRVYEDKDFSTMSTQLNEKFLTRFKDSLEENFKNLRELRYILEKITAGQVTQTGYHLAPPMHESMQGTLTEVYDSLQNNPQRFVDLLKESGISTPEADKLETSKHFEFTVEKYKAFMRLLFPTKLTLSQDEYLFNVGNRLFEYCFEDATFPHYQQLLMNKKEYPLVRCINTLLWFQLVGDGWKHWHKSCLNGLKQEAVQGKKLVYIAGGNDFYQLLKEGIYNIDIIDPFLPSQNRYYAQNWEWLVNGEIDDEILCSFDSKKITLKRTQQTKLGSHHVKTPEGKLVELSKGKIIWKVYDNNNEEAVGSITIHRRFAQQKDFDPAAAVVCSYDEAIYAVQPEILDGWGINPGLFTADQKIYIKQLRKPINKDVLMNIKAATMLNFTDVRFINYASDPN